MHQPKEKQIQEEFRFKLISKKAYFYTNLILIVLAQLDIQNFSYYYGCSFPFKYHIKKQREKPFLNGELNSMTTQLLPGTVLIKDCAEANLFVLFGTTLHF